MKLRSGSIIECKTQPRILKGRKSLAKKGTEEEISNDSGLENPSEENPKSCKSSDEGYEADLGDLESFASFSNSAKINREEKPGCSFDCHSDESSTAVDQGAKKLIEIYTAKNNSRILLSDSQSTSGSSQSQKEEQ